MAASSAGMNDSRISEEQRKRMELNRQKALERLAKRKCPSQSNLSSAPNCSELEKSVASDRRVEHKIESNVKAVFDLISHSRFRIMSLYNPKLIDVYQRIPSKLYDAKTGSWTFSLNDFNVLTIRNECSYVTMDLIPRAVVSFFTSSSIVDCSKETRAEIFAAVEPKVSEGLMNFQREAVVFAVQRNGRVMLADDMGLGKTVQAIAISTYYRREWPLLVICPSSVRLVWAQALQFWVPSLENNQICVVFSSSNHSTQSLLSHNVIITSYDLGVKMSDCLKACNFKVIITDESHFLKNFKTARCKSILPLLKSASRVLLLSGTPALSRPLELYTQLNAIDRSFGMSYVDFGLRYCNGKSTPFGWDFSGSSHMSELQMYLEQKIMIRRLKQHVMDQLPDKIRQVVAIEHLIANCKELKQMKTHLHHVSTLKQLEQRGNLLSLYEWTAKLKLSAVEEYIVEKVENCQKIIVFAHHRVMMDSLRASLQAKSLGYICIDGRTTPEARQELCDKFQHDQSCLVALLSITTANAGLTLTAASTVVFAELFWNPGIMIQAEDRAHRIGQRQLVNIYYLVAKGTVDDFIWAMVRDKLSVLSKAGLAKDDFSSLESVVMDSRDHSFPTSGFHN